MVPQKNGDNFDNCPGEEPGRSKVETRTSEIELPGEVNDGAEAPDFQGPGEVSPQGPGEVSPSPKGQKPTDLPSRRVQSQSINELALFSIGPSVLSPLQGKVADVIGFQLKRRWVFFSEFNGFLAFFVVRALCGCIVMRSAAAKEMD